MTQATCDERLFDLRLQRSHDDLFGMLARLYGAHPGYARFTAAVEAALRDAWRARPPELKWRDLQRDLEPDWFQRPDMAGYVAYADRFAGNLAGLRERVGYLRDLGVTLLHVMPCLMPRPGENDGGYSVMDYRAIDPALGRMEDFAALAGLLHENGISLCADMVLNHTAKEHDWARRAWAGDKQYRAYYHFFPDDTLPRQYDRTLVEVFPETAPGSFTHYPEINRWVWTSFNEHQWDLNWANPQVFLEMLRIMLFLANRGVDVLRLDAVAFMWKRLGTRCQSEPEVHMILHALRAASRVAAPATIHLAEAIVGPAEMIRYVGQGEHDGKESNLVYHNTLMVQIWSALAARDTRLMTHALRSHFPGRLTNATYATYLRCHDDIGWAVTDEDAAAVGLSGPLHRAFLSDFYEGAFPGSFARGAVFQHNPETGDKRISGSCAALAGLERAAEADDALATGHAIDRILMGHALIASFGGIPLIYMGDEIGLLNDHGYAAMPGQADDCRWIHRPFMDWDRVAGIGRAETAAARIHAGLRHILARRRAVPALHGAVPTAILDTPDKRVFAFARPAPAGTVLCLFNFSEDWTAVPAGWVAECGAAAFVDELSERPVATDRGEVALPPFARVWLR